MTSRSEQLFGTFSQRPAASKALFGVTYTASDTGEVFTCDGTSWQRKVGTLVVLQSPDDVKFETAYEWAAPTKLTNPPSVSAGDVMAVRWSPDGRYMLALSSVDTTNAFNLYDRSGNTLTKLTGAFDVATPDDNGNRVAEWSPNGYNLVIGNDSASTSTCLVIYQRSGGKLTRKLSGIDAPNTGYVSSASWAPDGRTLVLGHNQGTLSYCLTAYSWSNGSFVKLITNPPNANGAYVASTRFSPDGRFLAVGSDTAVAANDLTIYTREGTSFTKLTSGIDTPNGGRIYGLGWSPDGRFLAVASYVSSASAALTIYERSGVTFTKLTSGVDTPNTNFATSVAWSPDGRNLAVGCSTGGDDITLYSRSGTTFAKMADPPTPNAGQVGSNCISWSPDGRFLVLGHFTSTVGNCLTMYETTGKRPTGPTRPIDLKD